jgi:colanic acid biosynthesis glycosyl transferase WcaI
MKILVVTQYFSPEAFRVNDMVTALHDRGHTLQVLTGMPNYPSGRLAAGYGWRTPAHESYCGIPVTRVPVVTRGRSKNWRLMLNFVSFALSASVLGPLRVRGRYDVILVYQPSPVTVAIPALVMGMLKRAPVFLWIQDLWPDTLVAIGLRRDQWMVRAAGVLSRLLHRLCDRVLMQSMAFLEPLVASGVNRARIAYLPNWAESYFRPVKRETAVDPMLAIDGFRIVFAGNLGSAQSLETLLDAAQLLRNLVHVRWVVIGDGIMRDWFAQEIERRDLSHTVMMIGWQPPESMPVFFAHADALLVTLRRDPVFSLTIPSKLQTYLASGRPVLAALDGEGAATVSAAGAGYVTPAGDAAALAGSVVKLLNVGPAMREQMGLRGRAYYDEHFERSKLLDRLELWMNESAQERHANPDTGR